MRAIRRTMGRLRLKLDEAKENSKTATKAKPPRFAPAGQSTQMIIGADAANDKTILDTSANLYGSYRLKRVYYSAFSPIPDASRALPLAAPPLMREHRLYQADWLMRFYGFDAGEIVDEAAGMLPLDIDPKLAWALRHRDRFPLDVATASREELLRVPGFGTKAVDRIIATRRLTSIRARRSGAAAYPAEEGAAVHRSQRPPSLAASARWRRTGGAIQAESDAIGIWVLSISRHCERSEAIHASTRDRWIACRFARNDEEERRDAPHHPRQRNRFRRLAQSRARAGAERRETVRRDLERRGRRARTVRADARRRWNRRKAPSTSRPNSSNWRRSRSCIASPARFALLYRLLWRLRQNHDLLDIATDPDVAEIAAMAKAVRRDEHKMHAFVRFREVGREQKSHFVAWFEPEHHIVELAAPFFARRFADMPWSILTPDVCAHWDGHAVSITPGVAKSEAPTAGPAGGNLAALLRQHLQSGTAEGEGDAERDAAEILAEPAGGFVD